ncbi:MAG: hypothetical protein EOP88_06845 [Verrucomicrobiaceae bacterium]|nr:MAG: hypothetical protein EOP88_06845 [Verrucomicrobiaceae bacterium]
MIDRPPESAVLGDFILAWHFWNHERPDLAARFLARLRTEMKGQDQILPRIKDDAAAFLFRQNIVSFGDPEQPRAKLLDGLEAFICHFPDCPEAKQARSLADGLKDLIQEENTNPLLTDEEVAGLPEGQQAVEIVRRFRNHELTSGAHVPKECLKKGEIMIPALIAALDDHRPSRTVSGYLHLESVGDLAARAINLISKKEFQNDSGANALASNPGKPSALKTEVEAWWSEYQTKGARQYLIEAVSAGGPDCDQLARRLLMEFPSDAGPAVVKCYQKLENATEKGNFIGNLYEANNPECIALLRQEMEKGETLYIREGAARSLQANGQDGATAAMLQEWRKITPDSETSDLIRFLSNSQDAEVIRELTEDMLLRPVAIRSIIIRELADAYQKSVWNRDLVTPPDIQRLIEEKIASMLMDDQEHWGLSGVGYRDPTVGDGAAHALSRVLPDRYAFDVSASFEERELARQRCLSAWKKSNGQESPPPADNPGKPVKHPDQITEVRIADQDLRNSATGKRLTALEGKQLDPDELVSIICEFSDKLPEGINGIKVRGVRISKPVGFKFTVWSSKGKHPEIWQSFNYDGRLTTPGKARFQSSGSCGHQDIGKPTRWIEWRSALEDALKAPSNTELVLRIGIEPVHQ